MVSTLFMVDTSCHPGTQLHRCVKISAFVQRQQGSTASAESRPSRIGPITLDAKQTGERSEGNPYATFDVAETGNVSTVAML